MSNFLNSANQVIRFILGDKRAGVERRVKLSKRKRTRRKTNRRKIK